MLPDQGSIRARLQRRSFWRLRYTDGRVVNEWDCDWSLAPYHGRQSLRLHCPNGQVAELGNTGDATGRLFQLHGAIVTAGAGRHDTFHLIGVIDNTNGDCQCAVWDYARQRLVAFRDNVYQMRYEGIGLLNFAVLGIE